MAFRYERVRCGKSRCHCVNGSLGHGPYWYEYWREGRRTRKRYWGRRRPSARDFAGDEHRDPGATRRARAKHAEDLGLFGLSESFTGAELRRAYRKAAFEAHPDRGGRTTHMQALNAAYGRLRSLLR